MAQSSTPPLVVRDLSVQFQTERGPLTAADHVSFTLDEGKATCLVGESGCGKSVTALALLRLVPPPGQIVGGEVRVEPVDGWRWHVGLARQSEELVGETLHLVAGRVGVFDQCDLHQFVRQQALQPGDKQRLGNQTEKAKPGGDDGVAERFEDGEPLANGALGQYHRVARAGEAIIVRPAHIQCRSQ